MYMPSFWLKRDVGSAAICVLCFLVLHVLILTIFYAAICWIKVYIYRNCSHRHRFKLDRFLLLSPCRLMSCKYFIWGVQISLVTVAVLYNEHKLSTAMSASCPHARRSSSSSSSSSSGRCLSWLLHAAITSSSLTGNDVMLCTVRAGERNKIVSRRWTSAARNGVIL